LENKARIKEISKKFQKGEELTKEENDVAVEEMIRSNLEVQELKRKEKEIEEFWKGFYQKKADKIARRLGVEIKL
jgi:hypothetical protein